MINSTTPLTSALNAIVARIDGRFDDADLVAFGPLRASVESDCREIAQAALVASSASSEQLVPCTGHSSRLDAAERKLVELGYSWQGREWMKPIESGIAVKEDPELDHQVGADLTLPKILTDSEVSSTAVRRRYFLRDNLYFGPLMLALFLFACAAWMVTNPNPDASQDLAFICSIVGTVMLFGTIMTLTSPGSLRSLSVYQLEYLEKIATRNSVIASWLHEALTEGKQIRFKDYQEAQRYDDHVENLRRAARARQAQQDAVGKLARRCGANEAS